MAAAEAVSGAAVGGSRVLVPAARRVLEVVLKRLDAGLPAGSVRDLAASADLSVGSTHHYLRILQAQQYLVRDGTELRRPTNRQGPPVPAVLKWERVRFELCLPPDEPVTMRLVGYEPGTRNRHWVRVKDTGAYWWVGIRGWPRGRWQVKRCANLDDVLVWLREIYGAIPAPLTSLREAVTAEAERAKAPWVGALIAPHDLVRDPGWRRFVEGASDPETMMSVIRWAVAAPAYRRLFGSRLSRMTREDRRWAVQFLYHADQVRRRWERFVVSVRSVHPARALKAVPKAFLAAPSDGERSSRLASGPVPGPTRPSV